MVNLLLGTAIGMGSATQFRIISKIGLSEILFFIFLAISFPKYYNHIFTKLNLVKTILILQAMLFIPFMTILNMFFFKIHKASFSSSVAYSVGILLMFAFVELLRSKYVSLFKIIIYACITHIFIVCLAYFLFPEDISWYNPSRFRAASVNPNQLAFYGSAMLFLLSISVRARSDLWLISIFILIAYFSYISGSDAYKLSMIIMLSSFIILSIAKVTKLNLKLILTILTSIISILLLFYNDTIITTVYNLWINADEGNARINLLINSVESIKMSPVLGLGGGSFSGVNNAFEGSEVHNTFLDFASQGGVFFALLIYYILAKFSLILLIERQYFVFSCLLGYISITFFHFFGRHFLFWIILGIAYYSVYYKRK